MRHADQPRSTVHTTQRSRARANEGGDPTARPSSRADQPGSAIHRNQSQRSAIRGDLRESSRRQQIRGQRLHRSRSRSARAELAFSVSHVEHHLREGHYARRLSESAAVYMAAVIQCLTSKVLELARKEAHNRGCRRITPQFVDMAIHNNSLLCGLLGSTTISLVSPGC
ncbi:histone H2A-Bbd type 2/3 [Sorex araneus]|uniref:histone H2A-Bbd type 2/3 n=1 Tax=Sorex araneus TaxID=42254 RepID=UPI00064AF6F3|nr:histone H2A-Bbd type 2/3 [Sorex araneus]